MRSPMPLLTGLLREWIIEPVNNIVIDASGVGRLFGADSSVPVAASYPLGAVPALVCMATDPLSGLAAPGTKATTGGTGRGVGTFTVTAAATDRAGNPASTAASYRVTYVFNGFLQPVNDTAHQVGLATSVFKGGSTVPVKVQLRRADGTTVMPRPAATRPSGSATRRRPRRRARWRP